MLAKKRKQNTEWQRRDILERWKASGLSQAEFCRQENVPEWALSAWKRREHSSTVAAGGDTAERQRYGPLPVSRKQAVTYWKRIVQDQVASGLSCTEFCRRHEINPHTFSKWRRRLRIEQQCAKKSPAKENPFIAVQLPTAPAAPQADSTVEIALAGGSVVRVTEQTPLALLVKLLRALEATC